MNAILSLIARVTFLLAPLSLLLLLAGQARAQEGGNLIQFVTPWATSSPCFGDASQPLCAVETLTGCMSWARMGPDCARVFPQRGGEGLEENRVEYYFTRFKIVDKALDQRLYEKHGDEPGSMALPAGAFITLGRKRYCAADAISCEGEKWIDTTCVVIYSDVSHTWSMAMCGLSTEPYLREWELLDD